MNSGKSNHWADRVLDGVMWNEGACEDYKICILNPTFCSLGLILSYIGLQTDRSVRCTAIESPE